MIKEPNESDIYLPVSALPTRVCGRDYMRCKCIMYLQSTPRVLEEMAHRTYSSSSISYNVVHFV